MSRLPSVNTVYVVFETTTPSAFKALASVPSVEIILSLQTRILASSVCLPPTA